MRFSCNPMEMNTEAYPPLPDLPSLPSFDADRDVDGGGRTNRHRANDGLRAVKAYKNAEEYLWESEDYHFADAICDILHAAHREGHDIGYVLRPGISNFITETTGEGV